MTNKTFNSSNTKAKENASAPEIKTVSCKTLYKSLGAAARRKKMSADAQISSYCTKGAYYPITAVATFPDGRKWLKHTDETYSLFMDADEKAMLFSLAGGYLIAKTITSCNIRQKPTLSVASFTRLNAGTNVMLFPGGDVRANGIVWTRIIYNGTICWAERRCIAV